MSQPHQDRHAGSQAEHHRAQANSHQRSSHTAASVPAVGREPDARQRKLLVDQALLILEQNYVHLPLKAAMHAVNPLQRLRVMRARMERQTAETMEAEWIFHRQMSSIFHSVRDLHTNYLLPFRSQARSPTCRS